MKIIFGGTANFAIPALKKLATSKQQILAVYTKPDREAGRGLKLTKSPIKKLAEELNLPIYQPENFKNEAAQNELKNLGPDIFIDVAYGLLLPEEVLKIPRFGCINIHPSLLPRWRGAAPIQRAILAGDEFTGVSIMQIDSGLDTGPILQQEKFAIDPNDTTSSLENRLAHLGAELLLEVLEKLEHGISTATPQSNFNSTYAEKITKEEAKIDWQKSAEEISRMVRAFNPWPIAYTQIAEQTLRIWQAMPLTALSTTLNTKKSCGTILNAGTQGIDVQTGDGILRLQMIQFPGGRALPVSEILKSKKEFFNVSKKFN